MTKLVLMTPQKDLPPGPTWQCQDCGERVRTGQPHIALEPFPHSTLEACTVYMTEEDLAAA
jgi:hypothetical protein